MTTFFEKLKHLFQDRVLRNRVLFVLGALLVFRLMAVIPIPGVNQAALANFLNGNQFFGLLNIFSGGGLSTLSIVISILLPIGLVSQYAPRIFSFFLS